MKIRVFGNRDVTQKSFASECKVSQANAIVLQVNSIFCVFLSFHEYLSCFFITLVQGFHILLLKENEAYFWNHYFLCLCVMSLLL